MAQTGSISGHAFFDNNANSVQDGGEGGVASFPVVLYSADGTILYGSTTTDANGNYSFTGLADGSYALRFHTGSGYRGDLGSTNGDGYNWVTGLTVSNGAATTFNQGVYKGKGGTISGLVGVDANGNGQVDGGEGQGGVIVQVRDQSGNLVGSTQTAQDGSWSFSGLAGTYSVQIVDPLGQVVSGPASKSVTTTVGGAASGTAFLLASAPTGTAPSGSGSISGRAYFDPNANGVQEPGEASLPAGSGVDLYNADGTVLYRSIATDGNGDFSFGNLADGTYAVRYHAAAGYRGEQGITTADGLNWQTVTVSKGAATILNQGFNKNDGASISGTVYADTKGNGHIDTSDGKVNGAVVTLLDANGHAIQTATTGSNGSYAFNGLGTGQYSVAFDPGLGQAIAASPAALPQAVITGTTYRYVASILTTSPDKVAASLSGTVFADTNGNGKLDAGETGIAGAHVAVIDGNGFVVATLTADQNGAYSLPNPVAGQNYRVVVSPPTGYASENPQGATGLTLTAGKALDHVDLGLTAAAVPTTDAPPSVSKVINVVVRGQSNTYYATKEGTVEAMRQQIQKLLGFDGVNQRVNIVAVRDNPDNANTEWIGTALTRDWLHPDGSDWASTLLERGYLTALNQIPVADRGAPTAILVLHNETDSNYTTGLTTARWESAMRYEAGLARAVLGLSAQDSPYLYISPIPFAQGPSQQPLQNQAIAVGQANLSADPSFNAKVVALQTSDVTMNHDDQKVNGGPHLNTQDQQAVYGRAALGIAQEFASSAMPGSPMSQANGNIDNLGPQVTQVATVAGHPNQLLLTLAFDQAAGLQALNNVAAAGLGWSIRTDYTDATADANGTAAQVVDANHLLVTFDQAVPAGERLFYTWGSLRLAQNNGPGNGNAIYDNNGLPLSLDPHGLAIGYTAAGGPALAGTVANQITTQAAINPFATATLSDPNPGATDSVRITVSGAGGTLTGAGLVATNDGAYVLTGSDAGITKALHALSFTPSAGHLGTTTFTLQALSNGFPTAATDSTTTVINSLPPGSLGGHTFFDDNANSLQDGSEANLFAGFGVDLYSADGKVFYGSTTTDANGDYNFTGLADGNYALRFHTSGGYRGDLGSSTGDGSNWLTGLAISKSAGTTVNQGFYTGNGGTISGSVGVDANGNGQVDGGEGQGGVIVQVRDQSGNLVGSTQTGQDGSWSFSGLAGTYSVQVVDPLGQVVSGPASKSVTTTVGGAASGTAFLLAAAPSASAPSGSGSIGGHTYFDDNNNGLQDAGEGNLYKGFGVNLYNADGTVLYGSTATDGNGNYSFGNLADGTYALRFQTYNGFHGHEGIMAPDGFSWETVTVSKGAATILSQGFNTANAGTIDGTIYADTNGNGHIDTSDGKVNGAVVTLFDANGHAIQTATTGSNGFYYFNGLGSGQYSVQFDPGLGNTIAASPATVARTVVNGTSYNYEDILTTSPDKVAASLSGTVFADTNGNGKLDAGETGIAGAHVAVIDGNGFVVATLTADQNGAYSLPNPVAGQNYRVVVSPPTGYASENPQGATGLTLTAGKALDHVDLGLTAAVVPTTDAPPSVSKVINVVVRGQSNTYFPTVEGEVDAMRGQIEKLLGFDGVNQRVNIVAVHDDPNFANTEWSGTGLTHDWQHPNGSDWASTTLGRGYLSALNQIPVADRGAPTAILMLHNEWDSDLTTGLTAARWESAMRYEAGLARAVLGLSASDAPYLYVSPIPFAVGAPQQPLQNQAIAVGQAELSADPAFNAKVVTLQSSDVTMDHDGANGGFHLNTQDQQAVYGRAALGIAQEFAASAMPGSPVSQANGNIDNLGPQVTQVATVAGHANQLLLTLAFDQATSLQALNNVAAAGTGWSVRADYTDATADANGTAAQVVAPNQLLVTFDQAVPAGERLFYTWGALRLAQNNGPGNGNAIYDNNGLPLSLDPHGLAIGYTAAGGPALAGTVANQTTVQAAMNPFATATLSDPNPGATDSVRITVSGAGGTLTGAGLVATNDGAYTLTGSAASVTAALQALSFAPSATTTGTTTFTLQALSNGSPLAAIDTTTTVVTKPPSAGLTAVLANDTGASAMDGITKSGVITGVTDAGATVTLIDETNHTLGSVIADANGRYTITPTGLANGTHTLTAVETYLGVTASRTSVNFTLDSNVPAAPGLALAHDTGASATDRVTTDAALSVTPAPGGGSLSFVVDGTAVATYDPNALKDGAHTVSVTQTDAAGNVSAASLLGFTLDRTAPAAPALALTHDTGASAVDRVTADASLTVKPAEGGGSLSYVVDGTPVSAYDPSALKDGTHTVAVTQTDAAGNVSAASTLSFSLDRTVPAAPALALTHDTGLSATDHITADATLTITAAEGGGRLNYVVDGTPVAAYDPGALKDGAHTVGVTQTDAAGNVSAASTLSFSLDRTAPAAPGLALTHDTGLSATDHVTADATLTITPTVAGGSLSTVVDGTPVTTYDPGTLKDGAHMVSVTQTDAAGNVSAASLLNFTLDHTAPVLQADAASGTGTAAALTGNVLANDTGASALHLASVGFAGTTVAVPGSGTATVAGAHGTLSIAADGSYSYRPSAAGGDVFTETVADLAGNTAQTSLGLTVAPAPKAPIPASLSFGFALTDAHFDFSQGHDVMTAPDGTVTDLTGVGTIAFTDGTVQEKDGAALVDDLFYDTHYIDVWRAHVDPDQHYATYGWKEGRDPNAYFSTTGYLAANPDVKALGINPLTAYDQFGWQQGRDPSAAFDTDQYLRNNPDVKAAGLDPLAHYLQYGEAEGRQTSPAVGPTASFTHGSFDAEYYLLANADVAKAALVAGGDTLAYAYQHFETYGWKEGRNPNAFFDTKFYLAHNPDVAAAHIDPLAHYDQYGWKEGRDPSASFHTEAYLAANPDVAAAHIDPLQHFLQYGLHEGRHLV